MRVKRSPLPQCSRVFCLGRIFKKKVSTFQTSNSMNFIEFHAWHLLPCLRCTTRTVPGRVRTAGTRHTGCEHAKSKHCAAAWEWSRRRGSCSYRATTAHTCTPAVSESQSRMTTALLWQLHGAQSTKPLPPWTRARWRNCITVRSCYTCGAVRSCILEVAAWPCRTTVATRLGQSRLMLVSRLQFARVPSWALAGPRTSATQVHQLPASTWRSRCLPTTQRRGPNRCLLQTLKHRAW